MGKISLKGMNKAEVLAKLYNASRAQGMGLFHYTPGTMSIDEAQSFLDAGQTYFDYIRGRVMKIDLKGEEFSTLLYDRDNGDGAAKMALGVEDD